MFEPTGIPEDLKEMIEELVAQEELEKLAKENYELIQEYLYVYMPTHDCIDEETWKIEIKI